MIDDDYLKKEKGNFFQIFFFHDYRTDGSWMMMTFDFKITTIK